MKRKSKEILLALMAVFIVVGMMGCGNNNATVTAPSHSTAPPETQPPESSSVAENRPEGNGGEGAEESSVVKETEALPSETSVGNTEAEDADESEVQENEEISGLIIATQSMEIKSGKCEITSFDPTSGATKAISNFCYQTDSEYSYFFVSSDKLFSGSYRFDESYTRMAAIRIANNNTETHAGWLLDGGGFFDVSEAVEMVPRSDFADPIKHTSIGFTDDGRFVFCETDKSFKTRYYSVPVSDVSPSTVTEGYVMPYSACNTDCDSSFNSYTYPSDWLDATRCIVTVLDNSTASLILNVETGVTSDYIPGTSRANWNGRLSPDGTKIAFASVPNNGSEAPDIFIAPVEGGEPIRVVDHDFMLTRVDNDFDLKNITYGTQSCMLIDWR